MLSGVGVLDKSVLVLTALKTTDVGMSLSELQSATGLPRATAHRLANALGVHGFVRRDTAGRYALGFALGALGVAAQRQFPLATLARPVLEELVGTCGESVQLYVRDGDDRRCVVSLQSPHGLRWIIPEGSLYPLGLGSAGHVLAGEECTRGGWIESVEEREAGVASVSAPIFVNDGGDVNARRNSVTIGAVSISGPIERMTRQPGKKFGAVVVAASKTIGQRLRG